MWITWLILVIGGLLGLLCSVALTLFPMHPKEVESQAAAWLSHVGFSEWAKGLTKTTDLLVSVTLWILLAIGICLVLLALFRMFRRDSNAEAIKRNPGNGWRVSRLIMKARSMRDVEALCRDFLAQSHKTDEVRVLAARAVRQHRAEGGTEWGSWEFWIGLQDAMERHGSDTVSATVTELDQEFPPSCPVRCWMKYRQWREKKSKSGDIEPASATTAGGEESESTSTTWIPASEALHVARASSLIRLRRPSETVGDTLGHALMGTKSPGEQWAEEAARGLLARFAEDCPTGMHDGQYGQEQLQRWLAKEADRRGSEGHMR